MEPTEIPFDNGDPEFLAKMRLAAAGFIKEIILARAKCEEGFLAEDIRESWHITESDVDSRVSAESRLNQAKATQKRYSQDFVGFLDSVPRRKTKEEEEKLEELRENILRFSSKKRIAKAIKILQEGKKVDWEEVALWGLLPKIRAGLDKLPEKIAPTKSVKQTEQSAPRLVLESDTAILDGTRYNVSGNQMAYLECLMQNPGEFCSMNKELSGTKPSRVLNKLPTGIKKLIESVPGKGTRICLDRLPPKAPS